MAIVIFGLLLLGLGVYLSFIVTKSHRGDDPLEGWKP